jgi:elongation factor 2
MKRNDNTVEVLKLMHEQDKIRNISVIAHVDHGKTTLVDSLLAGAGLIRREDIGKKRGMDTKEEEKARGVTIKSTGVSLLFDREQDRFLINLVDSPGHVDFSSEVTAALRITDGALVVVDCVEGVCVQTETVTRQAIAERIRPVLHVNKVDRGIMELKLAPEDLYRKLDKEIQNVNIILSTYEDEAMGSIELDPRKGNVSFGSGKQGWAFTLPQFARMYAKKNNLADPSKILNRLWGDNFYDDETKRFTDKPFSQSGKPLERFFCKVVLEPIYKVFNTVSENNTAELEKILTKLNIKLTTKEKEYTGNDLLSCVMQKFLFAADALSEMIITRLPSPREAQRYRAEVLYTGPLDDEAGVAIRECNPNGPAMMFVSKMVEAEDNKSFYAFGRVFSGTLRSGDKVLVMNSDYQHPDTLGGKVEKEASSLKRINRLVLMMVQNVETIDACPCGNTVAVVGIDKYLRKSGTLSTLPTAYPIAPMKFSVSPVVRVAVEPKRPQDLPKFVEALRRLSNTDQCVKITTEETGEHVLGAAGELHLEVLLSDLKTFLNGVEFTTSTPVVNFMESISAPSSMQCMAKSQNKHNRLYATAEPLSDDLLKVLESDNLPVYDHKERVRILAEKHGFFDSFTAKKIWFFGPEGSETAGSNIFVDETHGAQYLHEIKDSVKLGFVEATSQGVLCGEPLRGVRFNLQDVVVHADPAHRGSGQVAPATKRALGAAQLTAKPVLVEPIYLAEIQTTRDAIGPIYSVLSKRRGFVFAEDQKGTSPIVVVKAYLPVMESFGFMQELASSTSGRAFPQLVFDHWKPIDGDPLTEGTLAYNTVMAIRKRKGMPQQLPSLDKYLDKL